MLIASVPDTYEKLQILSRDSQYDLACACGTNNADRRTRGRGGKWIYPVTLPNGGTSVLFKTLISNVCSNDCKYCPLKKNADIPRCTLNTDELIKTFLDYYNNGEVFGLFLSSGVIGTTESTMDRLISCAEILRKKHSFKGYIHLKILPGASPAAIEKAISVSNAVSLNIETPGKEFLEKLSTKKDFLRDIVEPVKLISKLISSSNRRVKQTTQFIVGAAGETDRHIVNYTAALYERIGIDRVYFSAYQNAEPQEDGNAQERLVREHRLYQVDFLFRKYGFTQSDIIYDNSGLLSLDTDPKEVWARNHPEFFPVNVNKAVRYELLRVPGLGPVAVDRILERRKLAKIRSIDDINFNKRPSKAAKFLDFGSRLQNKAFLFNF